MRRNPRHPCYPPHVATVNGLAKTLRYLRLTVGQPSLETLELITSMNGTRLPRSTASDLLRGNIRNPSLSAVLALAQACGETDTELRQCREAWIRAMDPDAQHRPSGPACHPPVVSRLQTQGRADGRRQRAQ